MDSVQVNPALALARIFDEADLYAHSDGLMTYSPTRKQLPRQLGQRLVGLVCVDLVPGLSPKLLTEEAVTHLMVPADSVRQLIKEVTEVGDGAGPTAHDDRPTALILGQYLSSLQLLTRQQESELHRRMIAEAATRGAEVCRIQATPELTTHRDLGAGRAGRATGDRAGRRSRARRSPRSPCAAAEPRWVISCFSTGLATARYLLGIEAVAVGTRRPAHLAESVPEQQQGAAGPGRGAVHRSHDRRSPVPGPGRDRGPRPTAGSAAAGRRRRLLHAADTAAAGCWACRRVPGPDRRSIPSC